MVDLGDDSLIWLDLRNDNVNSDLYNHWIVHSSVEASDIFCLTLCVDPEFLNVSPTMVTISHRHVINGLKINEW